MDLLQYIDGLEFLVIKHSCDNMRSDVQVGKRQLLEMVRIIRKYKIFPIGARVFNLKRYQLQFFPKAIFFHLKNHIHMLQNNFLHGHLITGSNRHKLHQDTE